MRAIDADALIDDLKHDVAVDQDSLDYEELTDSNREIIQFDKDCKQNAIDFLQHAPTIEPEPQIVQCEDCKYNSNTCGNYVNCDIIPQMFGRTADNYCSMAKRKEGTDESD